MTRARVNPFDQGTAERTLSDHYRKNKAAAEAAEQAAALASTEGQAHRAAAERYAEALRALGHGDKVTPLKALPRYGVAAGSVVADTLAREAACSHHWQLAAVEPGSHMPPRYLNCSKCGAPAPLAPRPTR